MTPPGTATRFSLTCLLAAVCAFPVSAQQADAPSDSPPAESAGTTNPDSDPALPYPIRTVTADAIRDAVESGQYEPFPRAKLHELSVEPEEQPNLPPPSPTVTHASYRAVLRGQQLTEGTLQYRLDASRTVDSVVLGPTSLRELAFRVGGRPVTSAALADGRLSLLTSSDATQLSATWSAEGTTTTSGTRFELQLPPAAVTELTVETDRGIVVTSPNAIVSPAPAGSASTRSYTLYPRRSHLLTIVCTRSDDTGITTDVSPVTVNTSLNVTKDSVFADWTLVLPPDLREDSVTLAVEPGCRITDILTETGSVASWTMTDEAPPQLKITKLRPGQLLTIHGSMDSVRPGVLTLPLLLAPPGASESSSDAALRLNATNVRLTVARDLAVRKLTLDGLYQQEVSFDSTGEQIIELRQFASVASAEVQVEPAVTSIHQRLLIHRPPETPGQVTVYAELEPRSDQTFDLSWQLSGAWQPTSVDDVTTGLPVYSRLRPSTDGSGDTLQVDLRSAASSIQPARLRIQFRSTQAITPQTSSLPILTNAHYRSLGTWILASSVSPFQTVPDAELIPNAQEELRRVFPWAVDDLPDVGRLQLTRTDRLPTSEFFPQTADSAIPRATVDYQLEISESLVTEEIRLQLAASDQLPDSMKLLFPEGLNVRLSGIAPAAQLTPTGRVIEEHWQEWLLTLPPTAATRSTQSVSLRISRPVSTAEFAAIPRLPSTSDVTLTARNITDTSTGFARAELVSESVADGEAQSVILEPAVRVSIQRMTSRLRLRFMRTRTDHKSLGIRGTVRMAISQETGEAVCHSLADLVLSRSGSMDSMLVRWPQAFDVRVFIDDQPVACPSSEDGTQILLPPDQLSTGLRMLWNTKVGSAGFLDRRVAVPLPQFVTADDVDLAHLIQIQPDDARLLVPASRPAADQNQTTQISSTIESGNPSIRSFLMNWQLSMQNGAASQLIRATDGQILFSQRSGRSVIACGLLVFCGVLLGRQLLSPLRLRTLMVLLLLGSAGAAWAGPTTIWCFSGWNAALCLILISRTCWQPLTEWWNQVESAEPVPTDSAVSAVATALVAILLTGQAPDDAPPPVLAMESMQDFVFVRRDLLPGRSAATESDVRVRDVTARVRLEPEGGTEITVEATVASHRSAEDTAFTVPVESATLTEVALNDSTVAPVRGADGRPQIRLPQSAGTPSTVASGGSNWQLNRISYTLRSDAATSSGYIAIRIPLPWSARTRLTLEPEEDPVISARLEDGPAASQQAGLLVFPEQYNRGPLDLQVVTQRSQAEVSARNWIMGVTCRARIMEERTTLRSRFQLSTPQLLPTKLQLPTVPGFQPASAVTPDDTLLDTTLTDEFLIVEGSRQQLSDFEVTWESSQRSMNVDRTIPREALTPPVHCSSGRTLLAVDVAEPFDVAAAQLGDDWLTTSPVPKEELDSLDISPSSRCFEIDETVDDVRLQLELQSTRRIANSIEQSLVVGVQSLAWSCQCDLEVSGPLAFRQRLQVPRNLLIDDVNVSGNRVRSWSVRDGSLLVTFREGTRGNVQLSVRGVLQIPSDGRIEVLPVQPEMTEVVESSFLVSSTRDAAAQVEDASGTDRSNPLASDIFALNPYPVRLTIVDPERPLKLSARPQEQTTARLLVLTHTTTSSPHSDIVLRIQAGDQSWDGRIRLPDELADATVDWITGEASIALPVEGGELPPQRLAAGEAAFLVLSGVRTPTENTSRRLPLPVLEPDVKINRVRMYARQTTADQDNQNTLPWVLEALNDSGTVSTPAGVTERGRSEHYDARDNSIHIAGLQTTASLPTSVVRRASHSIGMTHAYAAADSLAGSTDILIDFGDAEESRCSIPQDLSIISCQLDGAELPETLTSGFIDLRRTAQVQRLRIRWLKPLPNTGFLPSWSRLDLPTVDAVTRRQYLTLDSMRGQTWSHNDSLIAITPAQLDTRITATLNEANTSRGDESSPESATSQLITRFSGDQQQLARESQQLFEVREIQTASLRSRRNLPWTQWTPLIALGAVWLTVTSRQASRRRSQATAQSISSDLSDHSSSESGVSSDSTPSAST